MAKADSIGIYTEADLVRIARDIIDSYHYDTDFLAELVQNAVDAVRLSEKENREIIVEYDAPKGLFTIRDNGVGMDRNDLRRFALGRTDKATALSVLLIGEKGVGGSYVLLISDRFEVESVKDGKRILAVSENARDRVYQEKEPVLEIVEQAEVSGIGNYTRVAVRSVEFKSYSTVEELSNDLRMFTAIGNTKRALGEDEIDIKVSVTFITEDEEGNEVRITRPVDSSFLHPANEYGEIVIRYDELAEMAKQQGGKLDLPPGTYKDKLLAVRDSNNRILATFGQADLLDELKIEPVIVLGVKGAPMPVEIRPPKTGGAGYWRNLFVLINNDDVELDIGRKSITRKDKKKLDDALRDFFNKHILPHAKLFIPPREGPMKGALEQMKEQAMSKEDLWIPDARFAKVPAKGEELAVSAIFHELIGSGALKGYETLSESSDAPYDAIIRYRVKIEDLGRRAQERIKESYRKVKEKLTAYVQTGFLEFKVDATSFIIDCERGRKSVEDVMVLVAYDLNRKKMRKGWRVDPVKEEDRLFDGVKFQLVYEPLGARVPLILLKEFRHKKQAQES